MNTSQPAQDSIGVTVTIWSASYECGYTLVGTSNEWMNSPETMVVHRKVNRVNVQRRFSQHTFWRILEGRPGIYAWKRVRALSLWIPKQLLRRSSTDRLPLPS
jgi:hypothetical protein